VATAQDPSPSPSVVRIPKPESCAECGVVRSVKRIESKSEITAEERKSTSGLVASVPLGGGKTTAGSSTDVRQELRPPVVRYEIVVRLDDGRFQLVVQDDAGDLREGDKVVIERGRAKLRER
jgi:outer membrane lipoprotein SlyB